MQFMKIDSRFINLDKVTSVEFYETTVQRKDDNDMWALTYGYEMPEYQKRKALVANIFFVDGRGEDASTTHMIDAEPLRDWLESAAVILTNVVKENV